jgi:hypothetical protein
MKQIGPRSSRDRIPVSYGRSAEVLHAKRVRNDLISQCGGAPSASQRLLTDRIAALAARIRLLDSDPTAPINRDYLDTTETFARLLWQLGIQQAVQTSTIMQRPSHAEVAA